MKGDFFFIYQFVKLYRNIYYITHHLRPIFSYRVSFVKMSNSISIDFIIEQVPSQYEVIINVIFYLFRIFNHQFILLLFYFTDSFQS